MIDSDLLGRQLFVIERFDDNGITDRPLDLPAPPPDVRLLWAVCVPADDAVLAVVEGTDEQTTGASLTAAGWRVDRITPATWVRPTEDATR